MGLARIGTSGWAYPSWRGAFYPTGLPQRDWLSFYARHLNAVEVNASFYRLPSEKAIRDWIDKTPEGFRFAVKAWRLITHIHRLLDCGDLLREFLARAALFGAKLGPVLFQLPPRFPAEPARLARFLTDLPRDFRYACEFRDPSWHVRAIYELLQAHDVSFVPFDLAGLTAPQVATASFVYVRLHGHRQRYRGAYPEAVLQQWAHWLCRCVAEGREVWAFFDNTEAAADAVADARRLQALLEGCGGSPDDAHPPLPDDARLRQSG